MIWQILHKNKCRLTEESTGDTCFNHKPFLNSISSTSGELGASSGFLVIRHRSVGAWFCKRKHTQSISLLHTLYTLWWVTRTFWDPIKEQSTSSVETIVWGDKRQEKRRWCVKQGKHKELSEDKIIKKKSMFHFSPLFSFIFPAWPFTTGESGETWDAVKRGVEKGKREKWLASPWIVNTWQVTTHLIRWQKLFGQQQVLDIILPVCKSLWFADCIMCLGVSSTCLHLLESPSFDFLSDIWFCFFEWEFLLNGHHTTKPTKIQ